MPQRLSLIDLDVLDPSEGRANRFAADGRMARAALDVARTVAREALAQRAG